MKKSFTEEQSIKILKESWSQKFGQCVKLLLMTKGVLLK